MSQTAKTSILNRAPSSPNRDRSLRLLRLGYGLFAPIFFSILLLLTTMTTQVLSAERITVFYPDVSAPYKDIFDTILEGISNNNDAQILRYPLPKDYRPDDLKRALQNNRSDGIITLGKRGHLAVKQLKTDIPTVSGALSMLPNGISGISLAADPDALFSRLKNLSPASKRIFVVYSKKNTGWLIPLAEKAAAKHGLVLQTYAAENLRAAVHHYRNLLEDVLVRNDAIWLPLDKATTNDDVVLPMLLQKAWDKDLVILSNKPSHAKRGALFAMYPDNYGLGQELAALLNRMTKDQQASQVIPLKRLNLAVNLRTAAHLGLNFTPRQQEDFKITFPSR